MRRNEPELLEFRLEQRIFGPRRTHQKIVGADSFGIFGKAQAARGVRLGIRINKQSVDFGGGNGSGQIDGGRSLADAALLIGYSENASHSVFSEKPRAVSQNSSKRPELQ